LILIRNAIDRAIGDFFAERPRRQKVAMVVSVVMRKVVGIKDDDVAERIRAGVASRNLVAYGDILDWRRSEIVPCTNDI
jgi:hypothetical protein